MVSANKEYNNKPKPAKKNTIREAIETYISPVANQEVADVKKHYFEPSKFSGMDFVQVVTLTLTDKEL
ncbi:MAG: hypothetical protein GX892_04345 [Thermoanaerobacteraceae bacterium]|nr:hypothetical protein [Thermoanaerobacteraceae bacterium]